MTYPPAGSDGDGLAGLQQWLQTVITTPPASTSEYSESEEATEARILPSLRLDSSERLRVYQNAYWARLLEVLAGEFPAVRQMVGEDLFRQFGLGYLSERPSRSYTLGELGRDFAAYLARTRPPREKAAPDWADLLIDVARLERLYAEVFDGPGTEDCDPEADQKFREDVPRWWPECRLTPAPSLRLITLSHPAHLVISSVRRGDEIELPDAAPTFLAVHRRDYVVRRRAWNRPAFELLTDLVSGTEVADALASFVGRQPELSTQDALDAVGRLFEEWTLAEYFVSVEPLSAS